jgi:hypothetical protein
MGIYQCIYHDIYIDTYQCIYHGICHGYTSRYISWYITSYIAMVYTELNLNGLLHCHSWNQSDISSCSNRRQDRALRLDGGCSARPSRAIEPAIERQRNQNRPNSRLERKSARHGLRAGWSRRSRQSQGSRRSRQGRDVHARFSSTVTRGGHGVHGSRRSRRSRRSRCPHRGRDRERRAGSTGAPSHGGHGGGHGGHGGDYGGRRSRRERLSLWSRRAQACCRSRECDPERGWPGSSQSSGSGGGAVRRSEPFIIPIARCLQGTILAPILARL